MKVRFLAPFLTAVLALGPGAAAAPLEGAAVVNGTIVAGPGGFVSPGTYATPVVTMTKGTQAVFYNGDIAPHDVVSITKKGKKPLFASKLVGLGQSSPVLGTQKLPAGSYVFFCTRHHWMQGRLVVL